MGCHLPIVVIFQHRDVKMVRIVFILLSGVSRFFIKVWVAIYNAT